MPCWVNAGAGATLGVHLTSVSTHLHSLERVMVYASSPGVAIKVPPG